MPLKSLTPPQSLFSTKNEPTQRLPTASSPSPPSSLDAFVRSSLEARQPRLQFPVPPLANVQTSGNWAWAEARAQAREKSRIKAELKAKANLIVSQQAFDTNTKESRSRSNTPSPPAMTALDFEDRLKLKAKLRAQQQARADLYLHGRTACRHSSTSSSSSEKSTVSGALEWDEELDTTFPRSQEMPYVSTISGFRSHTTTFHNASKLSQLPINVSQTPANVTRNPTNATHVPADNMSAAAPTIVSQVTMTPTNRPMIFADSLSSEDGEDEDAEEEQDYSHRVYGNW